MGLGGFGSVARSAAAALAIVMLCGAGPAPEKGGKHAAARPPTAREAVKLERRVAAERAKAARLSAQADKTQAELDGLSRKLVAAGERRARAEADEIDARLRLAELATRERLATAGFNQDRRTLGRLLAGLSNLDRAELAGGPSWLSALWSPAQPFAAGRASALFSPALAARAQDDARTAAEARRMAIETAKERFALESAQKAIDRDRAAIQALAAAKEAKRKKLLANADRAAGAAKKLADKAKNLRDLIEQAARAAKPVRLASLGPLPAGSGKRLAPAAGSVLQRFGATTASGVSARGVTLSLDSGAQVVAPTDATVRFAGPFRSYGMVLILDRRDGTVVVLTGLAAVYAAVGQTVLAGEPVGEMGGAAHDLYFEVRRGSEPIDPESWLKART